MKLCPILWLCPFKSWEQLASHVWWRVSVSAAVLMASVMNRSLSGLRVSSLFMVEHVRMLVSPLVLKECMRSSATSWAWGWRGCVLYLPEALLTVVHSSCRDVWVLIDSHHWHALVLISWISSLASMIAVLRLAKRMGEGCRLSVLRICRRRCLSSLTLSLWNHYL